MNIEAEIKKVLAQHPVPHELMDCDPELADTEVFCRHYGIPLENSANTIIVVGKSQEKKYVACVLLAHTRIDVNRVVRKKLAVRRCSFANAEETMAITRMAIGGVTPLCLPATLPIWVDSRIRDCDYIILGGGSRSLKLKIAPAVFDHVENAEFIEGLAKPFAVPGTP